jgi:hypothetical protein
MGPWHSGQRRRTPGLRGLSPFWGGTILGSVERLGWEYGGNMGSLASVFIRCYFSEYIPKPGPVKNGLGYGV